MARGTSIRNNAYSLIRRNMDHRIMNEKTIRFFHFYNIIRKIYICTFNVIFLSESYYVGSYASLFFFVYIRSQDYQKLKGTRKKENEELGRTKNDGSFGGEKGKKRTSK